MIHVVAILTAHPGRREEVLAALRDNLSAVRAEEGCIEYNAAVEFPPGPGFASFGADAVVVIEKWAGTEALRAHAAAPHMHAFAERVRDALADRAVHVLSPA